MKQTSGRVGRTALTLSLLMAAAFMGSGCLGMSFGGASLDEAWNMGGSYGRVAVSGYVPVPNNITMEAGAAAGSATASSGPWDDASFYEVWGGVRAAPVYFSEVAFEYEDIWPYVGAGVSWMAAELRDVYGYTDSDSGFGLYAKAGISMADMFEFEVRYLAGSEFELFGHERNMSGAQASIWVRFDVLAVIALFVDR